jgi:hypothetical protein
MANLHLEWAGRLLCIAAACLIATHATAATVPGERVAQVARERLQAALKQAGASAIVGMAEVPPDVPVPAGRIDLQAREPMTTGLRGPATQRRTVWVDVRADGRLVRTMAVGVDVLPASAAAAASAAATTAPVRDDSVRVARALAVTRGGSATLRLSDGSIQLESVVRVLQDGVLGEQVRVRPANASADIVARVVGVGRLEAVQ